MFEQERLDIRLAIFGMVAPAALGFHTACRLHVNSTTVVKLYVMLLVVYETESNIATILSPKNKFCNLETNFHSKYQEIIELYHQLFPHRTSYYSLP